MRQCPEITSTVYDQFNSVFTGYYRPMQLTVM